MQKLIETHLEARTPGLVCQTYEEVRALECIRAAAAARDYRVFSWSPLDGIKERTRTKRRVVDEDKATALAACKAPPAMIDAVAGVDMTVDKDGKIAYRTEPLIPNKSVIVLPDFHLVDMRNLPLLRKLKEALWNMARGQHKTMIIVGADPKLPIELQKEFSFVEFQLPDKTEAESIVRSMARAMGQELNGNTEELVDSVLGLTSAEIVNACSVSRADTFLRDGTGCLEIPILQKEKASTLKKSGILELITPRFTFDQLGGCQQLKDWVIRHGIAFTKAARDYGLPRPKGVLFFGPPGTGKSALAQAVADALRCPLLKLDMGKLFGSLVGSSEANVRLAIATADAFGKCVLWLDEIDKGMAGANSASDGDNGTTKRVLATLINWMQEKQSGVFIVGTGNDISVLPAALLRHGRWDEKFFVDLPTPGDRAQIFRVKILAVKRKPEGFDLNRLASATNGWTGAEIEALINEALFAAFEKKTEPTTELLLELIPDTKPISEMMRDEIDRLRSWAKGRARLASSIAVQGDDAATNERKF